MFQQFKAAINAGVRDFYGTGAPTDGVTGLNDAGLGSVYFDIATGIRYTNFGTALSPVWAQGSPFSLQRLTGSISPANIIGTAAGQFGHANGVIMVPAQGAHKVVELVSCSAFFDFITAAYTAGGNITVNNGAGGAALTGLVSAANSLGAASDKPVFFVPLSTVAIPYVENGPINLVSSAAFTNPGTAAGVIRWEILFRIHDTGF